MVDDAAAAASGKPPLRNRSFNRRKSGDRASYLHGMDGERSQASYPINFPSIACEDIISSSVPNEYNDSKLIPLEGCSSSEAVQFLADRWAAAVHLLDDPSTDISEKPAVYSGANGSSWVHLRLPHQMNFLGELQRKIDASNSIAG